MPKHQIQSNVSLEPVNSFEAFHVDFMDIAHELHLQQNDSKKKIKARRRSMARRAIEAHQENKRLKAELQEWWDDL